MDNEQLYDVAIAGGGLAGLSVAIELARAKKKVILFEKERYPFHRVCGEYISLESYEYVCSLGIKLDELQVPIIKNLVVSSPSGKYLSHHLPLGGFGISRLLIDHELMKIALQEGVEIREATKVEEIRRSENTYIFETTGATYRARIACAAFGKRSNLDIKWKRPFVVRKPGAINNFIGVKYHVQLDRPADLIELHNFKDGYCGVSPIESGKTCVCYLTSAKNLKENSSIPIMEERVLFRNPFLKKIFEQAKPLYDKPLTISQVSFEKKQQVENGVIFLGDAASMIAPLCGNGMSMALQSSKIAFALINQYLENKISVETMYDQYTAQWNGRFGTRLKMGRTIQRIFGREWLSNTAILLGKKFPSLLTSVIKKTHG